MDNSRKNWRTNVSSTTPGAAVRYSIRSSTEPSFTFLGDQFARSSDSSNRVTLAKEFAQLADRWESEIAGLSFAAQMKRLDSFKQLVRLGRPAIPLVKLRLASGPSFWIIVLRELEG